MRTSTRGPSSIFLFCVLSISIRPLYFCHIFCVSAVYNCSRHVLKNLIFSPISRRNSKSKFSLENRHSSVRILYVFYRFYSEIPSDEKFFEHSGLVMSIALQIISANNGQLTAHNQAEGGACFRLTLPLESLS